MQGPELAVLEDSLGNISAKHHLMQEGNRESHGRGIP